MRLVRIGWIHENRDLISLGVIASRRIGRRRVDCTLPHRLSEVVLLISRLEDLDAGVSVVWSDDQKNVAITWSDGGAIGAFHVQAFHLDGDNVSELPMTNRAFDPFKARHRCEARGDNIQAHSWLRQSRDLLPVLSAYPTGDCGK
jgi:hypothetical protein